MNEDGVVDEQDKTILGNPNPDFTYGFQTLIAWKDLSVSASFNGVHGNQILNTNCLLYTSAEGRYLYNGYASVPGYAVGYR